MAEYHIAIGADHRGAEQKDRLIAKDMLDDTGTIVWTDRGCPAVQQACDYPLYARAVCREVVQNESTLGVLLCGTGVGMAVAANRFAGIYAALCWDSPIVSLARLHDHANVLVIPADYVSFEQIQEMIALFVSTQPLQDYHAERVRCIAQWGGLTP